MKTKPYLWAAMGMILVLAGCSRDNVPNDEERRIRFTVPGLFQAKVNTKATEVTSLNEFHVGCVKGTLGISEQEVWKTTFTSSGGETPIYVSDKYWPASDEGYKFFASNVPLNSSSTGYTISATTATDVVCAVLADPDYGTTNILSFEHIFSRLGNVTVEAFPGYTITGISITMTPKTGGTYNLRTKGWSAMATGGATAIANSAPGTKANDLYTVPGRYTLTASWTATDSGSNTVTYTNRTVEVELEKGVVNNATITLGGNITVGVSLEEYVFNDYLQGLEPLTFEALGNGNILWKTSNAAWEKTIGYSKDGVNWTLVTSTVDGAAIPVSTGDKVYIRGNDATYGSSSYYCSFGGTVDYYVYGNMTDLLAPGHKYQLEDYSFKSLFNNNTCIRSHGSKRIYLPSRILSTRCYDSMFGGCNNLTIPPVIDAIVVSQYSCVNMFSNCTSLQSTPVLEAPVMASYCYNMMFSGCTSLTTVQPIKAIVLAANCYNQMFRGCRSLTATPDLPVTTVEEGCYYGMFYNCSNLEEAPSILPALKLANNCYYQMFYNCPKLTTAPELPAKTLVLGCYNMMFRGCYALNFIKALFTSRPTSSNCMSWVNSVAATGTFVKADDATWDVSGNNGIPNGWTVYTESQWP